MPSHLTLTMIFFNSIFLFWVSSVELRETTELAQGHATTKWWRWDLNSSLPYSKFMPPDYWLKCKQKQKNKQKEFFKKERKILHICTILYQSSLFCILALKDKKTGSEDEPSSRFPGCHLCTRFLCQKSIYSPRKGLVISFVLPSIFGTRRIDASDHGGLSQG